MYETIESNPEHFGLELLHSIDLAGSYEFDTYLLLRNKETQKLFVASDSGCSCPVPFENVGVDDLQELTNESFLDFQKQIQADYYYKDHSANAEEFLANVIRAMNG